MTDSDWQQIDQIVMAVQTAELRQTSVRQKPTLNLSCNLVNIARGQCVVEITSSDSVADQSDAIGVTGAIGGTGAIGRVVIEIDRPVMRATATLPAPLYELLVSRIAGTPPRPIQLVMAIATKLAVSLEGDLRINAEMRIDITDLSATMPLK